MGLHITSINKGWVSFLSCAYTSVHALLCYCSSSVGNTSIIPHYLKLWAGLQYQKKRIKQYVLIPVQYHYKNNSSE